MASGGIRQDFPKSEGLTPGINRTLRWVAEDADGDLIEDFTGWDVKFFWLAEGGRAAADGPTALEAAALFVDEPTLDAAPNIDVVLDDSDWAADGIGTGDFDYELWRVDTDNVERLAYGIITVSH